MRFFLLSFDHNSYYAFHCAPIQCGQLQAFNLIKYKYPLRESVTTIQCRDSSQHLRSCVNNFEMAVCFGQRIHSILYLLLPPLLSCVPHLSPTPMQVQVVTHSPCWLSLLCQYWSALLEKVTELAHCVLCVLLVPLSLLYSSTMQCRYSECNEITLLTSILLLVQLKYIIRNYKNSQQKLLRCRDDVKVQKQVNLSDYVDGVQVCVQFIITPLTHSPSPYTYTHTTIYTYTSIRTSSHAVTHSCIYTHAQTHWCIVTSTYDDGARVSLACVLNINCECQHALIQLQPNGSEGSCLGMSEHLSRY